MRQTDFVDFTASWHLISHRPVITPKQLYQEHDTGAPIWGKQRGVISTLISALSHPNNYTKNLILTHSPEFSLSAFSGVTSTSEGSVRRVVKLDSWICHQLHWYSYAMLCGNGCVLKVILQALSVLITCEYNIDFIPWARDRFTARA